MKRLVLALLVATACGPKVEPPHLLYSSDAASLSNPFPDSRVASRVDFYKPFLPAKALNKPMRQLLDGYATVLANVEGLGNFGPTLLPASERLERASLEGHFARLQKTATGWTVLEADVPAESSRDGLIAEGKAVPDDFPEFVLVRPTRALPENTDGLLVVKKGLKTEAGAELGRGFEADEQLCDEASQALGGAEVLLALPVHAAPVSARFEKLVSGLDALPPAPISVGAHGMVQLDDGLYFDGPWAPADADWSMLARWTEKWAWAKPADAIAKIVYGAFPSHDLREDGVWKDAWVEKPGDAPTKALRFALVVPKGPRPAGGWPYVVVGHGISSRNATMTTSQDSVAVELGQMFASAGIATVGIDAPSHGSRGNPFDFFEIENLAKARENFRQMVADQMQLIRALPELDVDGDGTGDFQATAGYFGNSLGSIMGANVTSVDPRIRTSVLNVPGGGLSNILTGTEIRDRIGLLIVAKTGITFQSPEYFALFPFFRAVAQAIIDPGDPVNVGRMLPGSDKSVLAQEGVGDITIPNFTTEELAGSMGLTAIDAPKVGSGQHLLFRADPKAYLPAAKAQGYNGHGLLWEVEAAPLRAQAVRFVLTGGREFHPEGLPAQ